MCSSVRDLEVLDTCISGSIASPNEKAMVPRALKDLEAELPCKLYLTDVLSIFFPKRCWNQKIKDFITTK